MTRRRRVFLSVILFLFAPRLAIAGDDIALPTVDPAAPALSPLDEVVVLAAKRPQSIREAPASTSVITQADLEAYGWRDFTEAVAALAGFYTVYPGDNSYFGVRGVSMPGDVNGRILVLVDGHMQNELFSHATYPEMTGLDATMIDHIEVLRGPASALYGSLGFSAIINVVTRRGGERDWGRVAYEMEDARGFRGVASFGHRWKNGLELGISAQARHFLGRELDYPERFAAPCLSDLTITCTLRSTRERDVGTHASIYAHLEYKGFFARASWQWLDKQIPFAPYRTLFNTPNSYGFERAYVDVGWQGGLPSKAQGMLRASFDQFSYKDELHYAEGDTSDTRFVFRDDARPYWLTVEGKLLLEREWRVLSFALTLGGEFTWLRTSSHSFVEGEEGVRIARDILLGATYAQVELGYVRKLFLTLGLRGDFADQFPNELSPRAGLVLRPYRTGTFKLLYTHGFIRPSWYHAFFDDNTAILANPRLRPERADNFELVWQQDLAPEVALTTSLFTIRGNDLIDTTIVCVPETPEAPATPDCPDGMSARTQRQNLRAFQSVGVEASLTARLKHGIRLYGNYSFTRAVTGEGTRLFNSPAHLAKVGISAPLWRRHLVVGTELRVISPRLVADEVAGEVTPDETPTVFLMNAHVTWRDLPKGLMATLKVYNLTATRYAEPTTAEDSFPITRTIHTGPTVLLRLSYER
jgi:iron complex outermembrane receptor protein